MKYLLNVANPTKAPFKYVLFQKLQGSDRCVSAVWKAGDIPPQRTLPIGWSNELACCIDKRTDEVFSLEKSWDVQLHTRWRIEYDNEKNEYAIIEVMEVGSSVPD